MKKILSFILTPFLFIPALGEEFHLYLLAGQSNMDGRGQVSDLTKEQTLPSENSIIYYRNPPHSSEN